MPIQGLRMTTNFAADERPKNWREGILLLYPNGKAPLTGLTSGMKKRSVDDPEFYWWEKELSSQRLALTQNLDAPAKGTQQTITVDSGASQLKAGHLLWVEQGGQDGEIMLVSADPASDTSISVIRGYSDSTTATVDYDGAGVNPNLSVIGNAYEEGSDSPTGVNYDPTKRYNLTQIMRNTLEMTRTAQKTRLRTGDQVREAKRECLELHSIEMEKGFWFGKRHEATRNGKPVRTMDGVFRQIPSDNIDSAPGAGADMEYLEERLYEAFRFGSDEKMGFCGNRALLTINQIVRKNSSWDIQTGIKEYGMRVSRLICPFGELVLKTHPLWNQLRGGTTSASDYAGVESWLAILDMENFKYVHLDDGDTKYEPELQDKGIDGMKSGYLSEISIELHHRKTHSLIKGLTKAVEDS